jgi:mono/diheme cytochrome c family protein
MTLTMNCRTAVLCLVIAGLAVGVIVVLPLNYNEAAPPEPAKAPAEASAIRPFLDQHCVDCHGPTTAKAGLRLDKLPAEFADPEKARVWQKVIDRVQAGEMPPKKQPRPSPAETKQAVSWVHENLLAADRRAQPPTGSVVLRRLNRVQYENSIRGLLDLDLELQDRLPPDTRAFGFDNVGAALRLSSAQLEAYLDAADAALDAAIVNRARPMGIKQRMSGLEALTQYTIRQEGRLLELEEAAVGFGRLEFYGYRNPLPEEGRYRVRASVFTYKSPDKPLELYVRMRHTTGDRVIGYYEAPLDVPAVIEFTTTLKQGSYVVFGLPTQRYLLRGPNPAERPGPGIGVQWVEIEGPLYDTWPPPSHKRLFGDLPLVPAAPKSKQYVVQSADPPADAERLLTDFMSRAFRRPVSTQEVEPVLMLVKQHLADKKNSFEQAMRVGYKTILCSPYFLFFPERRGEPDDFALASRLSYFLWNTLPDEELLRVAGTGKLRDPATLRAQVERLLKHPNSAGFVRNFLAQWLDLRLIDSTTPDPKLYPEFDTALQTAMVREVELFFEELLNHDLSVMNVVDSDFTFLNERLATHYGIAGVKGPTLRRVPIVPGCHRGGILTMAAVLKVTANGSYTHPVHRGVWVLRNIVGRPPDPPPPNAGAVEPDLRGAKTIREQLDAHRKVAACAACHIKIDPPGFALESFDVTGAWRDQYRVLKGPNLAMSRQGPPVEPAYELADGRSFQNIDGLKKLLLEDKDQLARCLAEKLLIYGTGRGLRYSDRAVVNDIVARSRERGYGLRALVHDVVQSRLFTDP